MREPAMVQVMNVLGAACASDEVLQAQTQGERKTPYAELAREHAGRADGRMRLASAQALRANRQRIRVLASGTADGAAGADPEGAGAASAGAERRFLVAMLDTVAGELRGLPSRTVPACRMSGGHLKPRIALLVDRLAADMAGAVNAALLTNAVTAYQRHLQLEYVELQAMRPLLALALLDVILRGCDRTADGGGRGAPGAATDARFEASLRPDRWLGACGAGVRVIPPGGGQVRGSVEACLVSLRRLRRMRWTDLVAALSVVDAVFARDPAGAYPRMDAATQDRYRKRVSELALQFGFAETTIADGVLQLARDAAAAGGSARRAHVGYFLIDEDGVVELARRFGARTGGRWWGDARSVRRLGRLYVAAQLTVVGMATTVMAAWVFNSGVPIWALAGVVVSCVVLFGQLAAAAATSVAAAIASPRPMWRMDYRHGLPMHARTWVAVPCLLESRDAALTLVHALHMRYLANRCDGIHFALLSDFPDAPSASMPGDEAAWQAVAAGIRDLNERYPAPAGARFVLLHRERVWRAAQGVWMGYERKRGKLDALNAFLLGENPSAFDRRVGHVSSDARVRYVVTLDHDTELAWDGVRRLVETIDHPLNVPELTADGRRVVSGHAILQPRTALRPPRRAGTGYQRLQAWGGGVDPYVPVCSDLYHDLFGEGCYVGKGIYEVAAFRAVLRDRFPEDRILSHDLIEGCYARATVVTDVAAYELPARSHEVELGRRERWVRGDWQVATWLWPRVPSAGGRQRNTLSALSRWKIADNLRRSLVEPAALVALALAWLLPGAGALAVLVASVYFLSPLLACVRILGRATAGGGPGLANRRTLATLGITLARPLYQVAALPHSAWTGVAAIAKAHWRLLYSGHRLLEWTPFAKLQREADAKPQGARPLLAAALSLAIPTGLAAAVGVWLPWHALPWLLLWCAAPWIDVRLAKAGAVSTPQLGAAERALLGRASRHTWSYFEDWARPDAPLPPDHVREAPRPAVASRTSPTNIGFGLLAVVAAYDLGYLGRAACLSRIEDALAAIETLEKHEGHLYNWYGLDTGRAQSRYVSTVDSGNFVASLLVLRSALIELADAGPRTTRMLAGLRDTLEATRGSACRFAPAALSGFVERLDTASCATASGRAPDEALRSLLLAARALQDAVAAGGDTESRRWAGKLTADCQAVLGEATEAHDPTAWRLRIDAAVSACTRLAACSFALFFADDRQMLCIGLDAATGTRDEAHYDMLASEARLTVYLAVARNQVPVQAWAALGRLWTRADRTPALLSWGGSLFEYLMPDLLMPVVPGALLEVSRRGAVARQRRAGQAQGLPWGISESAHARLEPDGSYGYRDFGVPSLGLKPRREARPVVSPYSSALALLVDPDRAIENLRQLEQRGMLSRFGYYEAMDFGSSVGLENGTIVREYMAHHQGMSLLAFASVSRGQRMQARFLRDPELCAAAPLLGEPPG